MSSILGCDLGGTKCAIARYNADSLEVEEQKQWPTKAERGWQHIFDDLLSYIDCLQREDTTTIGIGVPGLVRQPEGNVVNMPNIPNAKNIALKKQMEDHLKLPVIVDNDANCFALAEARMGNGKGHKVVVGITMGTGVGGGIVINGEIFHGAHGFAGEIGHMLLVPGDPPYYTDYLRGEVEQFLSGTSWRERCKKAKRPKDYLEGEVCAFMHADVFKEVAWLCTNLTHLLDPDVIVFGGSAGWALMRHIEHIEKELEQWVLPGTPLPELKMAELEHAATLGAALLVQ